MGHDSENDISRWLLTGDNTTIGREESLRRAEYGECTVPRCLKNFRRSWIPAKEMLPLVSWYRLTCCRPLAKLLLFVMTFECPQNSATKRMRHDGFMTNMKIDDDILSGTIRIRVPFKVYVGLE